MSHQPKSGFQLLQPGVGLKDDWCNFPIPLNMEVGENTVIDSSSCFKKFFSKKPLGLKLGKNITLQSPALATEEDGYIEIGDYSYISGAAIISSAKIIIGKYVFIAGGVTIVDSDFHPHDPGARLRDTIAISPAGKNKLSRPTFEVAPVIIEDDVWIGYNATILKGVTIGRGSVIQPGAVILRNIPAGSMVSGNPAQVEQIEYA
jgi:acetyltransferase-like isoleucine patch superfamily enzyme